VILPGRQYGPESLGTLAGPRAAKLGHDAVWLTPLSAEPAVAEAMLSYPAHQLCVAGESDPLSDPAAFAALPGERLLVDRWLTTLVR
jgi:hypothetical protein